MSHLPGAVAALAAQVLPVGQQAGGAGALEGQPRVDEGRGAAVVVHKERLTEEIEEDGGESGTSACGTPTIPTRPERVTHLPSVVVLHLPAAGQLQLLVGEHVEEGDEVAVVLVALEVVSVAPHLADHVLQAGVARKHAVGTLGRDSAGREPSERDGRRRFRDTRRQQRWVRLMFLYL